MATTAYLTLKGQRQGDSLGSVTLPNHESSILVHSYTTEIDSTRDPASGISTGKWVHNPVVILKELDASSPLLWTALAGNETFVNWALAFFTTAQDENGAATETQIYTIRLTNASISSIQEFLPDSRDAATPNYPVQQQISFTYQKIEWIWTEGEVTAEDSWQ
jgi:type VI secretion system secreted protein Hcp